MNHQDVESFPGANRFDALKPRALNREEKASVIKLALSVLAERHRAGRALGSPEQRRSFLRLKLVDRKHEVFGALFLDLCAAPSNVELDHENRLVKRIRRCQLHINAVIAGASS